MQFPSEQFLSEMTTKPFPMGLGLLNLSPLQFWKINEIFNNDTFSILGSSLKFYEKTAIIAGRVSLQSTFGEKLSLVFRK